MQGFCKNKDQEREIKMNDRNVSGEEEDLKARWTLPKRSRLDWGRNLHVSSFNIVRDRDFVLFLRSDDKYPIAFKRGKLLLPAAIADYGESPREVAKTSLREQVNGTEELKPKFLSLQSYMGAHWDLVLIFESQLSHGRENLSAKGPFTEIQFHKLDSSLPRTEIAEDHLEVIDGLTKENQDS